MLVALGIKVRKFGGWQACSLVDNLAGVAGLFPLLPLASWVFPSLLPPSTTGCCILPYSPLQPGPFLSPPLNPSKIAQVRFPPFPLPACLRPNHGKTDTHRGVPSMADKEMKDWPNVDFRNLGLSVQKLMDVPETTPTSETKTRKRGRAPEESRETTTVEGAMDEVEEAVRKLTTHPYNNRPVAYSTVHTEAIGPCRRLYAALEDMLRDGVTDERVNKMDVLVAEAVKALRSEPSGHEEA